MRRSTRWILPLSAALLLVILAQVLGPTIPGPALVQSAEASRAGPDYAAVQGNSIIVANPPALVLNFDSSTIGPGASANWSLDTLRFHYPAVNASNTDNYLFVSPANGLFAASPGRSVRITLGPLSWLIPLDVPGTRAGRLVYFPSPAYVQDQNGTIGPPPLPAIVLPLQAADLVAMPAVAILGVHLDLDAVWEIYATGIRSVFQTQTPDWAFSAPAFLVALGLLIVVTLTMARFARVLAPGERFILSFAAVGLIGASFVVEDVWDVPLWRQYSTYALYGGGNPLLLWGQHPLWPLAVTGSESLYAVARAFIPSLSSLFESVALKVPAIVGFALVPIAVRMILEKQGAREEVKSYAFLIWTVNPVAIWVTLWGQRDVLGAALVVLSIALAMRGRWISAFVVLGLATAILEYFLLALPPLVLFQYLGQPRTQAAARRFAEVGLSIAAFGFVALAPLVLVPSQVVLATFGYRLQTTGGSSFLSVLGPILPAAVLWLAAVSAALVLFILVMRRFVQSPTTELLLDSVAGLILAFYVAAPMVNPQFLAAIVPFAAILVGLGRISPWWLAVYSSAAMLEFYAHFGFGEFISPLLAAHFDLGLFGVRGPVDIVLSMELSLLVAIGLAQLLSRRGEVFWTHLRKKEASALAAASLIGILLVQVPLPADAAILLLGLLPTLILTAAFAKRNPTERSIIVRGKTEIWTVLTFGYIAVTITESILLGLYVPAACLLVFVAVILWMFRFRVTLPLTFWLQAAAAGFVGAVAFGPAALRLSSPPATGVIVATALGLGLAVLEMLQCERSS